MRLQLFDITVLFIMRYFLSGRCVRLPKRKINFAHRKKRLRGLERPVIVIVSSPTLPQPYALNIIAEFDFSADFELTLWLTLYVRTCTVPLAGVSEGWHDTVGCLCPSNALEQLAFRHKREWFVWTSAGGWGSMKIIPFDSLIIILFMYTKQIWIIYVSSPF